MTTYNDILNEQKGYFLELTAKVFVDDSYFRKMPNEKFLMLFWADTQLVGLVDCYDPWLFLLEKMHSKTGKLAMWTCNLKPKDGFLTRTKDNEQLAEYFKGFYKGFRLMANKILTDSEKKEAIKERDSKTNSDEQEEETIDGLICGEGRDQGGQPGDGRGG